MLSIDRLNEACKHHFMKDHLNLKFIVYNVRSKPFFVQKEAIYIPSKSLP